MGARDAGGPEQGGAVCLEWHTLGTPGCNRAGFPEPLDPETLCGQEAGPAGGSGFLLCDWATTPDELF